MYVAMYKYTHVHHPYCFLYSISVYYTYCQAQEVIQHTYLVTIYYASTLYPANLFTSFTYVITTMYYASYLEQ